MRMHTLEHCPLVSPVRKGFRGGNIGFRDLMTGQDSTPGNYGLQLVHIEDEYHTPQHRHNFEQIRIMLEGSFSFGKGLIQHEGSVGYFCEGTYYTQRGEGRSVTLLLQIGGPSNQGFMSRAQLRSGIDQLSERGKFEDGVFTWLDEAGKKHNQDSYEAVWEHVHGTTIVYPAPQYLTPVLLDPNRFAWRMMGAGVHKKDLGSFNGYGLQLSQLQLQAGAQLTLDTSARGQLLFCTIGEGNLAQETYGPWSSAEVAVGETIRMVAKTKSEFYVFGLPDFPSSHI